VQHPITTSETRSNLTRTLARFRREGAEARPVLFGSHRRPEAVVLPYEAYRLLLDLGEDAAISVRVLARDAADDGQRHSLEGIAIELQRDRDL
jgi:PHD/YefM family antitoxin component YafN of YafNO toxin-antitoxin module